MAGSCLPFLPRSGWGSALACDRTTWYRNAKFGMFIHWWPYSQASVEASWPIMVPKAGGITEAEYRALVEADANDYESHYWMAQSILAQHPAPERVADACELLQKALAINDPAKKAQFLKAMGAANCPK